MELSAGKNIEIIHDEKSGKKIISAKQINKTNLKHGPFLISGDHVEIIAGLGVRITTTHPNKLTIEFDKTPEIERIIEMEKRIDNLEKALAGLLKKR